MNTSVEFNYPRYSIETLLNKIFEIEDTFVSSEKNKNAITRNFKAAFVFAEKKHEGQTHHSWEEYIEHLKRSLHIIFHELKQCIPEEYISQLICAVILHDVLEDTDATEEDIVSIFEDEELWKDVATIVSYVSKKPLRDFRSKKERNKEYHDRLKELTKLDWEWHENILKILALLIKAWDNIDNLRTLHSLSAKKIRETIERTKRYILTLFSTDYHENIVLVFKDTIDKANELLERKELEEHKEYEPIKK